MGGVRLRTKFLLSMVVVSAALTFTTLLVVRRTVQQEVRLGHPARPRQFRFRFP